MDGEAGIYGADSVSCPALMALGERALFKTVYLGPSLGVPRENLGGAGGKGTSGPFSGHPSQPWWKRNELC